MADLYQFPDIYEERFTERANQAYKSHYEKLFSGRDIRSLLDCSFGTGCLTFCLAELGYQISGSDLNACMLKRAREKAVERGLDISLVQCDFRELSQHFAPGFDCVMSTGNALAHVSHADIEQTLQQMDRLIRPGGCLYFDSRNWEKELQEKKRFRWGQPFFREDGVRINYLQDWIYHDDGSVSIYISQSYEREGKIFESREFEEHLHPFPVKLVTSALKQLGYNEWVIHPFPWFNDRPLEQTDWYCLLAQKPG